MKRSICWSVVFDVLVAAGCLAYLAYWDHKRVNRRKREEKLDESLEESFPASDPLPY